MARQTSNSRRMGRVDRTPDADADLMLANREAEEAVLGSILLDASALALVRPLLEPGDFSSAYLGSVYRAMLELADEHQPIDAVTLANRIWAKGGDPAPLATLVNSTPTAFHAAHYAGIVSELAMRRRLIEMSARIAELAADESREREEVLGQAMSLFRAIADRGQSDIITSNVVAEEFGDALQRWVANAGEVWGFPTGLRDLDALTGGLERELVIVAGRPSHGKSALMLQVARTLAEHGHGVLFFSLEMSVQSLMMRLACLITRIDSALVRSGRLSSEDEARIYNALAHISQLPLYWYAKGAPSASEIATQVARARMQHDIDAVVVDYLQLMSSGGGRRENRNLELGEITRALANLAHEEGLLVLAGSQLNRSIESRDVKLPRLADLRESGNIEQDADKVLFVHRPELQFRQEMRPVPPEVAGRALLILAKNRNGPANVGLKDVVFREQWGEFLDAARDEQKGGEWRKQ